MSKKREKTRVVQIPSPAPIQETPGFGAFEAQQSAAAEQAARAAEQQQQLLNVQLPELREQFAFRGRQRAFLDPILAGQRLGGEFGVLGTLPFTEETERQLLDRLIGQTRAGLIEQGLFSGGAQAELEQQQALNLATAGEQQRRQELFQLAGLGAGARFPDPNVAGTIGLGGNIAGVQSQLGTAGFAPFLAERDLATRIAIANAQAQQQAQAAAAAQPTLGGQLGGLAGNFALATLLSGGNPLAGGLAALSGIGRSVFTPRPARLPQGQFGGVGGGPSGFFNRFF